MPLVATPSIILQAFAFGESSRILRLLTREHGVQSVIAKGAIRPRSRFGGVLDPFTEGIASFYLKPSRDLHTLAGFDLAWSGAALGADLLRFAAAALLAEILIRTGSEQPDPDLFDAIRRAFRRLAEADRDRLEPIALAETWALIARLGFEPALDACVACGRALGPDQDALFDYTAGSVRCSTCAAGAPGRSLPPAARAALRSLTVGEACHIPRTAAHWRLLAQYIARHVVEDAPLRSLAFLAEALDSP